jgi:tRNA pseudouridine65 synthase
LVNNLKRANISDFIKTPIKLLFEDEHILAVEKPHSLLVHKTGISEDRIFLLQILRNQIGQYLYPVHRLDRATSGVLLFAKSREAASAVNELFRQRKEKKHYLAIVRGWMEPEGQIDYALKDTEIGLMEPVDAVTDYQCLARSEMDYTIGFKYQTARFSLLWVTPITGRRQQIRKHLAHVFHPIIGDRRHGDVKFNNYFRDSLNVHRMLLHATKLTFYHPFLEEKVDILSSPDDEFLHALEKCGLSIPSLF